MKTENNTLSFRCRRAKESGLSYPVKSKVSRRRISAGKTICHSATIRLMFFFPAFRMTEPPEKSAAVTV